MTTSPIWRHAPAEPIVTKFGVRGLVAEVNTGDKFCRDGLRSFRFMGVRKWGSPIDLGSRPYNRSALPCCLWCLGYFCCLAVQSAVSLQSPSVYIQCKTDAVFTVITAGRRTALTALCGLGLVGVGGKRTTEERRWTCVYYLSIWVHVFKWKGAMEQTAYTYSTSASCCSRRRRHRLTAPVIASEYSKVSPNTPMLVSFKPYWGLDIQFVWFQP